MGKFIQKVILGLSLILVMVILFLFMGRESFSVSNRLTPRFASISPSTDSSGMNQGGGMFDMSDQMVQMMINHPSHVKASQKARATFREFLEMKMRGFKGKYEIQFPLRSNDRTELVWMTYTEIFEGRIHGRVSTRPSSDSGLKIGDAISIALAQIDDWKVTTRRKTYGQHTTVGVLRDQLSKSMPEASAKEIDRYLKTVLRGDLVF